MIRPIVFAVVIAGVLMVAVGGSYGALVYTCPSPPMYPGVVPFRVFIDNDTATNFSARIVGGDFPVNTQQVFVPNPPVIDWFINQASPGLGDGFYDMNTYPDTFAASGFWLLTWQIQGFGNDNYVPNPGPGGVDGKELAIMVSLQHVAGPHGEGPGFTNAFAPYWITNGNDPQSIPYIGVEFFTPHVGPGVFHENYMYFDFSGEASGWNFDNWQVNIQGSHVPVPGSLILAGIGLSFAGWWKRRSWKTAA